MVSFQVSQEDLELISKIVDRAYELARQVGYNYRRQNLLMDITVAHAGSPLRLKELLDADELDFWHDIVGILAYLDRQTGKMRCHFVPRFSA